jgi:hypothetical protein
MLHAHQCSAHVPLQSPPYYRGRLTIRVFLSAACTPPDRTAPSPATHQTQHSSFIHWLHMQAINLLDDTDGEAAELLTHRAPKRPRKPISYVDLAGSSEEDSQDHQQRQQQRKQKQRKPEAGSPPAKAARHKEAQEKRVDRLGRTVRFAPHPSQDVYDRIQRAMPGGSRAWQQLVNGMLCEGPAGTQCTPLPLPPCPPPSRDTIFRPCLRLWSAFCVARFRPPHVPADLQGGGASGCCRRPGPGL